MLIAGLNGLVLTGGRDVDPSLYDEAPHQQTDLPDHRRDRFELILTRAAIEADLPFLAIGRGMHILNVAQGGALTQHLPDRIGNESHKPNPVKMTIHDVQVSAASKLGGVLGETAQVPAAHRQAINRIGNGLFTVAWTMDQVVEAIEMRAPMGPRRAVESRRRRRPPAVRGLGDRGQVRRCPGGRAASARSDRAVQAIRQAARRPLLLASPVSTSSARSLASPYQPPLAEGRRCNLGRTGAGCSSSRDGPGSRRPPWRSGSSTR